MAMWHLAWLGAEWGLVESLGEVFRSPPTIASWGSNRLDFLALGTDYVVWHSAFTGSQWTSWESLGGAPLKRNLLPLSRI